MSKDKIELGDVWIDNETHFKITFIMVSDYYCEYLKHRTKLCESFEVFKVPSHYEGWKYGKTYLGKCKANINDLFEVQDDQ